MWREARGIPMEAAIWRCIQCQGGSHQLSGSGLAATSKGNADLRVLRGDCGGPISPDLPGASVDVDGLAYVTGETALAGSQAIAEARYYSCPNVYVDPLSPAYEADSWLLEAFEGANGMSLDQRLSDALPNATRPMRQLVQHIQFERQRRAREEAK